MIKGGRFLDEEVHFVPLQESLSTCMAHGVRDLRQTDSNTRLGPCEGWASRTQLREL